VISDEININNPKKKIIGLLVKFFHSIIETKNIDSKKILKIKPPMYIEQAVTVIINMDVINLLINSLLINSPKISSNILIRS